MIRNLKDFLVQVGHVLLVLAIVVGTLALMISADDRSTMISNTFEVCNEAKTLAIRGLPEARGYCVHKVEVTPEGSSVEIKTTKIEGSCDERFSRTKTYCEILDARYEP